MKIAYVIDSTVELHDSLKDHPDIYKIPVTIQIDEKEYLDGVNITNEELFHFMRDGKKKITTSLPSVGKFVEMFETLLKDYDYVVALMLSSHLSGTYNSASVAAQTVSDKVKVINTNLVSYPISYCLQKFIHLIKEHHLDKVVTIIEKMYEQNETYVVIEQLDRLHKSGRLSDLSYYVGSLLNLAPVIMVQEGKLKIKEKVRSSKKAKERMMGYLHQAHEKFQIKEVAVLYTVNKEEAKKYVESLKAKFQDIEFNIYPIGTAIGVHSGEYALGIAWFKN